MTQQHPKPWTDNETYLAWDASCEGFLQLMDRLDAEIGASKNSVKLQNLRERDNVARLFAEHLQGESYWQKETDRVVVAIWGIEGVPKKKLKEDARMWMEQRGIAWNGSAPSLREQVKVALEQNEEIPHGYFGLYVERTVEIREPRHAYGPDGTPIRLPDGHASFSQFEQLSRRRR